MNWVVSCEREVWSDAIAIRLGQRLEDNLLVMQPAVMEEVRTGSFVEPSLRLPTEVAQRLMDELWHAGLRPAEGKGSAGQLAAMQAHLADMRKLVFKEK